ncbi:restriction endonuclease subunit S [Dokdonia sp. Asnod2-E02]|uniref:restriction endonuclease subunit S n=1 Tax=Dokdonia sp. Asnod2-E02 TaxID=3160574 RepID=UPI00386A9CFE
MPQNWKTYKLGDLSKKIYSGGTPSTKRSDYYGGNIPWLNTKEVNFGIINETAKYITEKGLTNSSAKWVPKNSVIIAMYGNTAGKSAVTNIPLTTNQACCNLIIDPDVADFRYVYYQVFNDYLIIKDLANGGAQQNLNAGTIKNLELQLPPLPEQTAIASILSTIDAKIENNLAINKTLEEMAMALYKEWFVDFGPFQEGRFVESELGMIPEGWVVKSVYSTAKFINGASFKPKDFTEDTQLGLPVIKIVEIKQGVTSQTKYSNKKLDEKYIINNNDILFPWSGNPHTSLGIHLWDKGEALLNQHIFVVRVSNSDSKCYVFNMLKNLLPTFINLATHKQTTGLGHVTVSNLKELKIPVPNKEAINDYEKLAKPILDMIYSNQMKNQTLTNLRDTLLPKLISGEVRLNEFANT